MAASCACTCLTLSGTALPLQERAAWEREREDLQHRAEQSKERSENLEAAVRVKDAMLTDKADSIAALKADVKAKQAAITGLERAVADAQVQH